MSGGKNYLRISEIHISANEDPKIRIFIRALVMTRNNYRIIIEFIQIHTLFMSADITYNAP